MSEPGVPTAKVIVLGNSCVGKTSIVVRFGKNTFNEASQASTIGAAYVTREIDINGRKLNINLWDTAGQERFRSIIPMYVRGCNAILLTCSTDNEESVGEMDIWAKLIKDNSPNIKTIFIVMNKIDQKNEKLQTAAREYARVNNYFYEEVSAKENIRITELFQNVGEKILENGDGLISERSDGTRIVKSDSNKKSSGCC